MDAESWFQESWPEEWEAVDISVKELLPVVVAVALWCNTWQAREAHSLPFGQHGSGHQDGQDS